MNTEEIKQAVEEYFKEMLAKDADYLDHITGCWIYDAEDWFRHKYNLPDWDESEDTPEEVKEFWKIALVRRSELYDEKYSERDTKFILNSIICQAKELRAVFENLKHNLKVFPTFNNVVSTDINNLLEHLQTLSDIENGKIESLKKGK